MNPKTTPKDFFLHLGATVALYLGAIALISLSYSIVNYYQPDVLAGFFTSSSIAWPVSSLIILIPLLYVLEWLIGRDITRMPEKREIWVRRWRIYLTLFLTGATIAVDLIYLIYTFLNGEVTGRLVYKVLIVLIVSAVIFAYYILGLTKDDMRRKKWQSALGWLGIVLVVAAIVGGFLIVGTPAKQRALRLDGQRVSDLLSIQYQVINYWQSKGELPATLESLRDPISGTVAGKDPETGSAYGFNIKGPTSFELCALFSLASEDTKGRGASGGRGGAYSVYDYYNPGGQDESWAHASGNVCFDRTIDPDRYPSAKPLPKPI